jgi:hypothetical protein
MCYGVVATGRRIGELQRERQARAAFAAQEKIPRFDPAHTQTRCHIARKPTSHHRHRSTSTASFVCVDCRPCESAYDEQRRCETSQKKRFFARKKNRRARTKISSRARSAYVRLIVIQVLAAHKLGSSINSGVALLSLSASANERGVADERR